LTFSALDAGLSQLLSTLPGLTLAEPEVVDRYMNALGLAFVGRYVARRPEYGLYLRSGYDSYLSQGEPFRLFMVNAGADVDQQLITPLTTGSTRCNCPTVDQRIGTEVRLEKF
jgi:predicted dienelactone hydrolase